MVLYRSLHLASSVINKQFTNIVFLYKSDLQETFNHSLTEFYLINCLTTYKGYIVH